MLYYDPTDNKPKRWASLATLCYIVLLGVAFWLVTFDFTVDRIESGDGMLINFGDTPTGIGTEDLAATDVTAQAGAAAATQSQKSNYLTDDDSDVKIADAKQTSKAKKSTASATATAKTNTSEGAKSEPQTVNRRALFPGRTVGSTSKSEGASEGTGNQGDKSGSPEGSHDGTGQGSWGVAWNLSGRNIVGSLPKPAYTANAVGNVIIEVIVSAEGRVTSATYRAQGSTTNNSTLIAAAREAAMKARFTESESLQQAGTITYKFKMN